MDDTRMSVGQLSAMLWTNIMLNSAYIENGDKQREAARWLCILYTG